MIEKYPFEPTYTKDSGLWLLNVDNPDIPGDFTVVERNIIRMPGGKFGGNHRHPRSEAFVGIAGDLHLVWQDKEGEKHTEKMDSESGLQLFVVHSLTPHAVLNRGTTPAVLIEFANAPQHDVEAIDLLNG
jgi:oxalate decarboxylase/phosphoglucose isomerase-like protein (cupin superfamily)